MRGKDTRTVHAGYMMSALLGVVLKENNGRGTCGPGNEKRWWVVGECQQLHWGKLLDTALEHSRAHVCTECRAR